MMAIPALIVVFIMGSTLIHLAGETLVSTLSTVSLVPTPDWSIPAKKSIPPPVSVERSIETFPFIPEEIPVRPLEQMPPVVPLPVPIEETPRPPTRTIRPEIKLPSSEYRARKRVIAHLGGESKYRAMENDMGEAFAAAESSLGSRGVRVDDLDILAVADFTKPSYVRRLTLYHPGTGEESRHLVSHGTRSGKLYATKFSNRPGSHQTSPGLYRVGKKYRGSHGESLRLHGLDKGINDRAHRRAIVLHSAWYVSYKAMVQNLNKEGVPRLGCSHGCPAVHVSDLDIILEYLTPGSFLYIHTKR